MSISSAPPTAPIHKHGLTILHQPESRFTSRNTDELSESHISGHEAEFESVPTFQISRNLKLNMSVQLGRDTWA
jgi:hypothetical protein